MSKIVDIDKAIQLGQKLRNQGKKIVLAGGCFDILHVGHIMFLEKARAAGDVLFVLLEADETIKKIKGENRPVNNQEDRAKILAALASVDGVIKLGKDLTDQDYDSMIASIKPGLIATTAGDPFKGHKERQAKMVGGRVIEATTIISDQSTSRLVALLGDEL